MKDKKLIGIIVITGLGVLLFSASFIKTLFVSIVGGGLAALYILKTRS